MLGRVAPHAVLEAPEPRTGATTAGNNKGNGIQPCGRGDQATKGAVTQTLVRFSGAVALFNRAAGCRPQAGLVKRVHAFVRLTRHARG
jgi:hypothetical protein